MDGGVEAIGDAATGGIVARAVEPQAGEATGYGTACLNCGTALVGTHCHACGQQARVHRTLGAFGHDLMHGVLHFEGKAWRTLPMLAWRPGELTRRYVEGERARFVSPLALFLFSVFLMFAVFSTVGGPLERYNNRDPAAAVRRADAERQVYIRKLAELRAARAASGDAAARAAVDIQIKDVRDDLADENIDAGYPADRDGGKFETGAGRSWFANAYRQAGQNPKLLGYKIQNNAYKFSWALIPISIPFVWLLFAWRRQFKLYDHTVFVTHSLTFMTLMIVVFSVIRAIGVDEAWTAAAILFIPPLHMFRHLRGAYSLSWFRALWRTLVLVMFAVIAASLFGFVLFVVGVAG